MAWSPNYVTAAELKSYLRIADTDDDAEIAVAIAAASRAVDAACNRQFGESAAVARFYTASGDLSIPIDDVQTIAGLEILIDDDEDGTYDVELTDYRLFPLNAAADGLPYTRIVQEDDSTVDLPGGIGRVQVTATWGWTAVPETVEQATLIQAARFFARRNAPFGVAGSPETGSEIRLLARVDPDVYLMLRPYVRHWVAV